MHARSLLPAILFLLFLSHDLGPLTACSAHMHGRNQEDDDMKTFAGRLFDAKRQKQRFSKLLLDAKDAAKAAYVMFLGPHEATLQHSWTAFERRLGELVHGAKRTYDVCAERLQQLHVTSLRHTKAVVATVPVLRSLFPGDSNCEVFLVYIYLLLGSLAARLAVAVFRNVLYA